MKVGANTPGIEAEAISTRRNKSSCPGWSLAATTQQSSFHCAIECARTENDPFVNAWNSEKEEVGLCHCRGCRRSQPDGLFGGITINGDERSAPTSVMATRAAKFALVIPNAEMSSKSWPPDGSASKPSIRSLPNPGPKMNISASLPLPPSIVSLPAPPFRTSAPLPPKRVSLPPRPLRTSLPLPPVSVSSSLVPVSVCPPLPPTMVRPTTFVTLIDSASLSSGVCPPPGRSPRP